MTRILTVATLAALTALVLPAGPATADGPTIETTTDRTLTTGEYIDPTTMITYHYDVATGVLTPTGTAGGFAGYVCIDLYDAGTTNDPSCPTSLGVRTCPSTRDFCVVANAALVFLDGAHHQIGVKVTDFNFEYENTHIHAHDVVNKWLFMQDWFPYNGSTGSACGYVRVDGALLAQDCLSY